MGRDGAARLAPGGGKGRHWALASPAMPCLPLGLGAASQGPANPLGRPQAPPPRTPKRTREFPLAPRRPPPPQGRTRQASLVRAGWSAGKWAQGDLESPVGTIWPQRRNNREVHTAPLCPSLRRKGGRGGGGNPDAGGDATAVPYTPRAGRQSPARGAQGPSKRGRAAALPRPPDESHAAAPNISPAAPKRASSQGHNKLPGGHQARRAGFVPDL